MFAPAGIKPGSATFKATPYSLPGNFFSDPKYEFRFNIAQNRNTLYLLVIFFCSVADCHKT